MTRPTRMVVFAACALVCATVSAQSADGKLPMYPHARNMNDMPASAVTAGVPLVLETADSVHAIDTWYASNAPKSCARSTQSGGVKYACPGGNIMIYEHGGKSQVALIPAFGHPSGR